MGRDSSVRIATRYGLDGPGIESLWGARFSAPIQTGSEAHPASYTVGTGSFQGVKRPARGVHHPPVSSAEVKERVELYLYSPSGPLWPVLGWVIVFYIYHHNRVQEGLGLIPVPCILKMKLVPPSLLRSSYVSSSFWFMLYIYIYIYIYI